MNINGGLLIGGSERRGANGEFSAIEAASGKELPLQFGLASVSDAEDAAALAREAFKTYRCRFR
ncbi:hypothetical protein PY650_30815 [Rhizobium calliandrae]|uniref:Aldehyde dehydrogenase family protein n=1 Tax=Rhizobium calliandrae TaxID=1312182 RepID=A0ABT7KMT2_9HYPH|nr:hypothetical protein [Rhizobium calliandrae]MDL2409935.1 hypothetical protein [Rhizobium calliandrae]